MATSTIKLYNVGFGIEQNAELDSIRDYLATLTPYEIYDFQLVKHDLDIFIKVNMDQSQAFQSSYNYVSIKNSDITRTYYYYIIKSEWVAQSTVKFTLSLDTLNTFKDLQTFTSKTAIQREHKDRFIRNVTTAQYSASRIIDKIPEDTAGLLMYKTSTSSITGNKYYLVYCSNQGLNVGDTNANDAINCYIVPNSSITVTAGANSYTGLDIVSDDSVYRIFTSDSVSITIAGVTYSNSSTRHYGLGRYSTNTSGFVVYIEGTTVTRVATNIDLTDEVIFSATTGATALLTPASSNTWSLPIYDALDKNNITYSSGGTYAISPFSAVNRTLSYLIKIIECPYAPLDINYAISQGTLVPVYTTELNSNGMFALKLSDLDVDFNSIVTNVSLSLSVTIPSLSARLTAAKDITYESKLYNSNYYYLMFSYDSFDKMIEMENITFTQGSTPLFAIEYKQSSNINSGLYFKFKPINFTWTETENYEQYLLCNRNNEVPIYNSSYLDYIRTGYNYDKKAKAIAIGQAWTNTGISALGAGLGMTAGTAVAGATAVSLATSSIRSIAGNLFNQVSMQNQIEQKLQQSKRTSASVSGSDDLSLLKGYNGNALIKYTYSVSDEVKSNLFELFYKCGYAAYKAGIPDTSSRYRFNYLQCEADFSTKNNPEWKQYLEDVMERFRKGVTYFHQYDDFEQTLENWESWLITE